VNLSGPFNESDFERFIEGFLPDFHSDRRRASALDSIFPDVTYLGASELLRTSVFVVRTTLALTSRITLTKASFKILKNYGSYRSLIVYLNPDETIWRLSLLSAQPTWVDGKLTQTYSNPERHSYLLGSDVGVATARKFLLGLGQVQSFDDLRFRFSLEAINREFYKDIVKHFYDLIGRFDETGEPVQKPLLELPGRETHQERQEYAIRLFGRLIFCWFLKEKQSKAQIQLLPSDVFDEAIQSSGDVLKEVLEPLFFGCLNTPANERHVDLSTPRFQKVPYLNGGLFQPIEGPGGDYFAGLNRTRVRIPKSWFSALLETLRTYNFTIDENLEFDVELSIDPEMLGRIFENLLAEINPETGESARRTTGSFYTPRRIVNYMVDESLKHLLLEKTEITGEKITALISVDDLDDAVYPLTDSEREQVSTVLYSLRALDPACGSGAFPIGLLQKLAFILEQTDPHFRVGKSLLSKSYLKNSEHLSTNFGYLRKLVLIRDVIHGVDIQPIAVEISKLRCFLTLIVEQEVLDDKPNRGVEPLPNLDFQFVCGNSLISLADSSQHSFWEDATVEGNLNRIRSDFYSTASYRKRELLKAEFLEIANQQMSLFGETRRTSQLRTFRPFEPNCQATFFDTSVMFGIPNFDVVIGNPPYVKTEHLSESTRNELQVEYFETRNGKRKNWSDDLYVHFIFRAFDLASEKGIVCFITNDSFVGLESKKRVREKLLDENLLQLVSCPKETFGATIYTAIFLAQRSNSSSGSYLAGRFTFPQFELTDIARVDKEYVKSLPNKRFALQQDPLVVRLLTHDKLGKFLRVIDTGIHSGNVRAKLFSLEKTAAINQRMIQGRQLVRWAVDWDSPSAKYKFCNPAYVASDSYGVGRGGRKSTSKEYWHFCGDIKNHFLPERVLLRQTGDSLFAGYQSEDHDGQLYTDNTLFTVVTTGVGSLKYFLGVLNSRLLNYVYQYLSAEQGKTLAQVKTGLVEQLPMIYEKKFESQMVALVDRVIAARRLDPTSDVSRLESEIDEIVFNIFGLSKAEQMTVLEKSGVAPTDS
jgi:hypothetical protein